MKKRFLSAFLIMALLTVTVTVGTFGVFADNETQDEFNVSDCVTILKIEAGTFPYNSKWDINHDGLVTSEDADILAEYIAGLRSELPPKKSGGGSIETPII